MMPFPSAAARLRRLGPHLAALSAYMLLAIALTWPSLTTLATHIPEGDGGRFAYSGLNDATQYTWNFWWGLRALTSGQNPFATDLLFYPDGTPLYLHTLLATSSLPLAPLTALAGPVAAYNLSAMLGLAFTGYAVFLLAGHFAGRGLSAWAAGALVAASPFLAMKLQVSHLNLLYLGWLALLLLCVIRFSDERAWRYVLLGALCLICTVLTDWYLAVIAAGMLATWALLTLWRAPRRLELILGYALMGLLAALALAPVLAGVWSTRERYAPFTESWRALWQVGVRGYSSDAVGLLFPSLLQPHWRGAAEALTAPLVQRVPVIEGWYIAAGWTLLGLAAVGAWHHGRAHWRLLALAAVGWLLALGPELRLLGFDTGLPMPYALLQRLPMLENGRRPNLFAISCILVAAIFAAQGLRQLIAQAGRRRGLLLAALAILAVIELWPPPRQPVAMGADPLYAAIAARPGPVIDLPVGGDIEARTLLNQIAHGQPILRGYISRPPAYPTLSHAPLVRALALIEPLPEREIIALDDQTLRTMQCFYGFRHVVAERPLIEAERLARLQPLLARLGAATPWHDDGRFVAYELPAPVPSCAPFVYLGAGWNDREDDGARVWRWIGTSAELWVVNPTAAPAAIRLSLHGESYSAADQRQTNPLHIGHAEKTLAVIPIERTARTYHVILSLPPGANRLVLTPAHTYQDVVGRPVSISVSTIAAR
jgi:hypothetical protein